MKRTLHTLFALSIVILCYGCIFTTSKNHSVLGTWKFRRIQQKSPQIDKTNLLNLMVKKDGDLLNIFRDSTVSILNAETQQIGNWHMDDGYLVLTLNADGSRSKKYETKFSTTKSGLEILKLTDESDGTVSVFSREATPLKDIKQEPFHPSQLQWRIKASASESFPQLQKRLENYIKHVSLILYVAKQQKPELVSFELSQGPIRIYSSGIGVLPFEMVKPIWKNAYYNEQEAAVAHKIFEDYLRNNKYKGVGTGKWVEDDYDILLAIDKGLQSNLQPPQVKLTK